MPYEFDPIWQWWPALLVMVGCALRFAFYLRRRRDPRYHGWQPVEMVAVRSLVTILLGKPVTPAIWKRIDLLMLALMLLGVAVCIHDWQADLRHPSPLRRSPSSNNAKTR